MDQITLLAAGIECWRHDGGAGWRAASYIVGTGAWLGFVAINGGAEWLVASTSVGIVT
jgi:hypothetical protein